MFSMFSVDLYKLLEILLYLLAQQHDYQQLVSLIKVDVLLGPKDYSSQPGRHITKFRIEFAHKNIWSYAYPDDQTTQSNKITSPPPEFPPFIL